jgi:hypothetical protein
MAEASIEDLDISQAFPEGGQMPRPEAKLACLRELHGHYMQFFVSPAESLELEDWSVTDRIAQIERAWNQYEEARVYNANPALPATPSEFNDWFTAVAEENEYPDLCYYLRHDASLLDIALLVLAEGKVEGYFDDLIALAQVGSSSITKMTIARNYWDEMGNGDYDAVHTTMLERTTDWMREYAIQRGIEFKMLEFPEAYANACQLLMYSLRRRYLLRGLAGLGLLEQTAPARFAATVDRLKQLGVPKNVYRYESAHAVIDRNHGREWVDGVFLATMKDNPSTIREFAIGVLIRGNIAADFFRKVHSDLFGLG